jgi:hypothetical protein
MVLKSQGKGKVVHVHGMQAHKESTGTVPLVLNSALDNGVLLKSHPSHSTLRGKTPPPPPVHSEQEAGWAPEPVCVALDRTLLPLPGFETQTFQPVGYRSTDWATAALRHTDTL